MTLIEIHGRLPHLSGSQIEQLSKNSWLGDRLTK